MAAPALTTQQAIELLERLRKAAPPATAARLGEAVALVQRLAQENEYLHQTATTDSARPLPPFRAGDVPRRYSQQDELLLLQGLNEALRAPLVAIHGRADLMQAGLRGEITADHLRWVNSIHENTHRAFMLLEAVQQMIDLHTGRFTLNCGDFITSELLQAAFNRAVYEASARDQELTVQMPQSVPVAYGDYDQCLAILNALLDNAVRYNSDGGHIRLSVDSLGSHVLFSVADSGIGLTADDLEHIGRPFWRGAHRMVRQQHGAGLRLYLARQILALQQGELIFSGEAGLGSTFSFILPAA